MTQLWTAFDLTEATGGDFATPFNATGVSIDTRTLQPGDLFIRKSPAATVAIVVDALQSLFGSALPVELIGIRHGEKMHETLATGEEMRKSKDMGEHLCIQMDQRDLNYAPVQPDDQIATEEVPDFTSVNTLQLDRTGTEHILLRIPEIRRLLEKD